MTMVPFYEQVTDTGPLDDRIQALEVEKKWLVNEVARLEGEIKRGAHGNEVQLSEEIKKLQGELAMKDEDIKDLKGQQSPGNPPVATVSGGTQPNPYEYSTGPNPNVYPGNVPPRRSGWGYRGEGDYIGPSTSYPRQPGQPTTGYEPYVPDLGSGYPHNYNTGAVGDEVNPSDPEYIHSVTSLHSLDQNMNSKLCPVQRGQGRDVYMSIAQLYGARVDVNENGIWFDRGELLDIISKLCERSVLNDLSALVKGWSLSKSQISDRREQLVALRKEYDKDYAKFQHLNAIIKAGGPEKDKCIEEYRRLTTSLNTRAMELVKGLDITPGLITGELGYDESKKPSGGHTELKFCPVAMARGEKVIMARVELFKEEIDASEHGLWFDQGELENILKKVQKKDGGMFGGLRKFMGRGALENFRTAVADRIEKIKQRDETHRKLQEMKGKQQFGEEYDTLKAKYTKLCDELNKSVDITPGWLP